MLFVTFLSPAERESNKKYTMARNKTALNLMIRLYKLTFIFKFAYIMLKISNIKYKSVLIRKEELKGESIEIRVCI